ncbi:structural maintenance of chromosomes protein 2-like [Ornithodoros turicata]|uniref:structural maintenance of chromosomes protein 2-like n=1 Tax=Ornithodoros turicata TaxID=34597 RepID=UPI00313876E5
MYIKSITIDGFKSYGQRTEVKGFDPLFNAITGLNGSGKSNILDSICFLLGITNLSQVRATNLQELVFKNGQAGITKATVSITFDNKDKKQCPVGYEHYDEFTITRQVVVGGRNKYLINGVTANANRVQDLFRSVQLNVNNPHFLIMQGRITKVLNMKPPEILSMIEEAAGTRMYESKKQTAEKTIEKKDAKLTEINSILSEEITPTLDRLKAERQAYMEYTKVSRELEHLTKLHVAWQYVQTENVSNCSEGKIEEVDTNMRNAEESTKELQRNIEDICKQIKEMEKKVDEETGQKLSGLEKNLQECQLEETKVVSDIQHVKDRIKDDNKSRKALSKNIDEDNAAITSKKKQAETLQAQLADLAETSKKDTEAVAAAQKHFQAVSAGLSSNTQGEEATIAEQLRTAKSNIAEAETEMKQAEMQLKHSQDQVKKQQAECKKTESDYKKDEAACKEIEKRLGNMKGQIEKLNYEEGKEESLLTQKRGLEQEIHGLGEKIDVFEARNQHLAFHYADPVRNFDRSKVLGLVCDLFSVKDPQASRALELAAGGRLYNIVVDNEETGKLLLKNGKLKRRVTIIPLNKIAGRSVEPQVLKRAQNLVGQDKVFSALSLVSYDPAVAEAMKFVFGTTLITTNMDDARVVAFDNGVLKRTVSYDGASFDPSGVISGGAQSRGPSTLEQVAAIRKDRSDLQARQQQLTNVNRELGGIQAIAQKFSKLKEEYDLKETEMAQLRSRLQQSTHHQLLQQYNSILRTIDESKAKVEACKKAKQDATARAKELEAKIKDAKNIHERELKAAEQQIASCRKKAEESVKKSNQKKEEVEGLRLEVQELEKGLESYNEQIAAHDAMIQKCEKQLSDLQESLTAIKAKVTDATNAVKGQKEKLKEASKQIRDKNVEKEGLQKKVNKLKLNIQQWEHDLAKIRKESNDAQEKLRNLLHHYPWIDSEKQYFGKPNTEYDFKANNPSEVGRRIQCLKDAKEKLGQNVNKRVQNMLLKAEEQYQDLMQKKRIVMNDKAKISDVIKELDEMKNQVLQEAWKKVNEDFGSIFSTLLPGTSAKLVPPEGMTVLDGLEVKVAFGNVWKESLTELSGGQRSLVALSLILSLLLFKPAPIYILDEVDAALDLSHTQNIGQMLRTHFKHSQFIVVSLKEGMFNNANVLFKTKFVDGMSTVTRFAQRQ